MIISDRIRVPYGVIRVALFSAIQYSTIQLRYNVFLLYNIIKMKSSTNEPKK